MAGHSKWANIKHRKAAVDAKRGKLFTRLSKEITIAAKNGADPEGNPRLRTLIEKAREANMPIDNIQRAIKKGTGELPGASYEAITYEGYGPAGVAIIVECLTDNKNRTVADVRRVFTHKGGSLGETGSVSWMFEKKGVLKGATSKSEDELLEHLMDYTIDDLSVAEGNFYITCAIKDLDVVKQALKALNATIESAEIEWVAKTTMELEEQDEQKLISFLDELEALDDVQDVYNNVA